MAQQRDYMNRVYLVKRRKETVSDALARAVNGSWANSFKNRREAINSINFLIDGGNARKDYHVVKLGIVEKLDIIEPVQTYKLRKAA